MTTERQRGEGLIGRWSRLKRAKATGEVGPEAGPPAAGEAAAAAQGEEPAATGAPETPAAERPVRLPELPSIESLGAGSDYASFMAPGVPEELRRQALRKAWTSDPRIAGFRGFADYDWDYNEPGYGQLLPIDDIRRLCEAVLGPAEPESEAEQVAAVAEPAALPSSPEQETVCDSLPPAGAEPASPAALARDSTFETI
jgi:hypothetical protein